MKRRNRSKVEDESMKRKDEVEDNLEDQVSKAKPGEIYEVVHKEIVQQRKIKVVKRVGKAINRRWQDSYRRFRVRTGQLDRYEKIQEV